MRERERHVTDCGGLSSLFTRVSHLFIGEIRYESTFSKHFPVATVLDACIVWGFPATD
jgi:hypothetical protein